MAQRIYKILMVGLTLAYLGCGPRGDDHSGAYRYSEPPFPQPEQPFAPLDPNLSQRPAASVAQVRDLPQAQMQPEEEAQVVAPMLFKPERKVSVQPYRIPPALREKLKRQQPKLVVPQSQAFEILNQHLHVSLKTSTMTFTALLRVSGKPDEQIELSCRFDKSQPWWCSDMLPTDPKVLKQRRLQARVHCVDRYRCERVTLEMSVMINKKREVQVFHSDGFYVQKATSGDVADDLQEVEEPAKPVQPPPQQQPEPTTPQQPPESPRPEPVLPPTPREEPKAEPQPQPQTDFKPQPVEAPPEVYGPPVPKNLVEEKKLDEKEIEEVAKDPNAALEIRVPDPLPPAKKSRYSVPGIEKTPAPINKSVPNQAVGFHAGGFLQKAAQMPPKGEGFKTRELNRAFGTDIMINMLQTASAHLKKIDPNGSPITVASISTKTGGRLCRRSCQKSHQTGLDVDVVFPTRGKSKEWWPVCQASVRQINGRRDNGCRAGTQIHEDFDDERFWELAKQFVCAKNNPVIVIFLDSQIKKHMCEYVKKQAREDLNNPKSCAYRTLQAMKHSSGHFDHAHIRLRCPGNEDCRDSTVSLAEGTGC